MNPKPQMAPLGDWGDDVANSGPRLLVGGSCNKGELRCTVCRFRVWGLGLWVSI